MLRLLPQILASVGSRHPTAPPALVERCVADAVRHYGYSRVRAFLPVLVERRACELLASAGAVPDLANAAERGEGEDPALAPGSLQRAAR